MGITEQLKMPSRHQQLQHLRNTTLRTCIAAARHEDVHSGVLRQAVHAREVAVVVADRLRKQQRK